MFRLDGKSALVTGAGSGIGQAIAQMFAEAGAEVIVADRDPKSGEAVAKQISSAGRKGTFRLLDVSSESDCEAAARARVDILVNNAGIGHVGTILQTSGADLDRMYQVNVKGVFNLSKTCLTQMLERKAGCIINMASIGGVVGIRDRLA